MKPTVIRIVDDDSDVCDSLSCLLSLEGWEIRIYTDPKEFLAGDLLTDPGCLILDYQMPELNGLELSRLVGNKVKIIFTTAFEQYALEGFRVDALDYLLKPFNYTEFLRAATKALRWSEMSRVENVSANVPDSIFVKSDYKLIQIQLKDILYIEGLKDYIRIQTEDQEGGILTLMSMKSIEDHLPGDIFIRVHRSYIVNINKIKTIERNRIVFGKLYIPISDSYKERFMELLAKRAIN